MMRIDEETGALAKALIERASDICLGQPQWRVAAAMTLATKYMILACVQHELLLAHAAEFLQRPRPGARH